MHDGVFLPDRHNARSSDVHNTSELNVLLRIVHERPRSPLPAFTFCLAFPFPRNARFQIWRADSKVDACEWQFDWLIAHPGSFPGRSQPYFPYAANVAGAALSRWASPGHCCIPHPRIPQLLELSECQGAYQERIPLDGVWLLCTQVDWVTSMKSCLEKLSCKSQQGSSGLGELSNGIACFSEHVLRREKQGRKSAAIRTHLRNKLHTTKANGTGSPCGERLYIGQLAPDTYKTTYDQVKRCREREINIKASERVNVDYEATSECRGWGNGISLRKPIDLRYRPVRFIRAKIRPPGIEPAYNILNVELQRAFRKVRSDRALTIHVATRMATARYT
ncbi:hypothetical protein PR048_014611 [Dryococelus australis]|uniref:Reverse transcriptase n=1 Tax=Dryococelus australis TaxID=614101 RepID=A0ABQ9HEQ3_9NEOP|nr:hypothetical protein PR048_014611 [Dryococelus australis]